MDDAKLEALILASHGEHKKRGIRNKNAVKALLGAFSNPLKSLGDIFLGAESAIKEEEHRAKQDLILDLLCNIDDVLTRSVEAAGKTGIHINGLIEAHAEQADEVVGLDVAANAGPVELHPGTRITASAVSARQVTGARFGGPK